MPITRGNSPGFSLVELMVALVAGLIVVAAVIAFMMSSFRSNAEYVQATRLTQELRNATAVISDELRRAGYDSDSIGYVANPGSPASPFTRVACTDCDSDEGDDADANSSCVVYGYDRNLGTPGVIDFARGEVRALRRAVTAAGVGVIEIAESTAATITCPVGTAAAQADYSKYPPACQNGWCALTDPTRLNVSRFKLLLTPREIDNSGLTPPLPNVLVRDITLTIRGVLNNDANVVRGTQTRIRVRSDCVENVIANCNKSPGAA